MQFFGEVEELLRTLGLNLFWGLLALQLVAITILVGATFPNTPAFWLGPGIYVLSAFALRLYCEWRSFKRTLSYYSPHIVDWESALHYYASDLQEREIQ